jgi:hypothetical protein
MKSSYRHYRILVCVTLLYRMWAGADVYLEIAHSSGHRSLSPLRLCVKLMDIPMSFA